MSLARTWRRLPGLILALLAMAGLLGRAPAEPGPLSVRLAGIEVALCHTGGGKPGQPEPSGCDTCVLCLALHAAVPVLPVGAALPPVSVAMGIAPTLVPTRIGAARVTRGAWARAPPIAA